MFEGMKAMFGNLKEEAMTSALRKLAPGVVQNILDSFENLIDETAVENDMSPYLLHIRIERKGEEILGFVCWEDIVLKTVSLMETIEDVFSKSLGDVPKMFGSYVENLMQNNSIKDVVLSNLEDCFLVLRFNEDDELVTYKVQGAKETLLDWMDFIATAKVEL